MSAFENIVPWVHVILTTALCSLGTVIRIGALCENWQVVPLDTFAGSDCPWSTRPIHVSFVGLLLCTPQELHHLTYTQAWECRAYQKSALSLPALHDCSCQAVFPVLSKRGCPAAGSVHMSVWFTPVLLRHLDAYTVPVSVSIRFYEYPSANQKHTLYAPGIHLGFPNISMCRAFKRIHLTPRISLTQAQRIRFMPCIYISLSQIYPSGVYLIIEHAWIFVKLYRYTCRAKQYFWSWNRYMYVQHVSI